MTIPKLPDIKIHLLRFLKESIDGTATSSKAYKQIAKSFPKLTKVEKTHPYQHATSKWANAVLSAKADLVDSGFIYKKGDPEWKGHGIWTITKTGRDYFDEIASDLANEDLIEIVSKDLDALEVEEERTEGGIKELYVTRYERDPKLRTRAMNHHGVNCMACGFNFEKRYGKHGKSYIEVHHIRPLSTLGGETKIDPVNDMIVLCSNCHRMIHRKKDNVLSLDELKAYLKD